MVNRKKKKPYNFDNIIFRIRLLFNFGMWGGEEFWCLNAWMEFVEAKNICSQEFLEGGAEGKSWGLPCTSQDSPPGCGAARALLRVHGLPRPIITHVGVLPQLASLRRPEMPVSPWTSALQAFVSWSSLPSRRGGGC